MYFKGGFQPKKKKKKSESNELGDKRKWKRISNWNYYDHQLMGSEMSQPTNTFC